mmetsp:Transcript_156978/g.301118  ORF Transcript_156978/g.301118 Transcript_156978/m.301118 type:complete len:462 (-) Transcript_156978:65-1450(-)
MEDEEDPNLPTFKLRQTGPPRAKVLARAARELYVPADVDDTHPIFDLGDTGETDDVDDSEADNPPEAHKHASQPQSVFLQFALMSGFIALGCANVVMRQIVAVSLSRYAYMLSLVTALTSAPLYFWVLFLLIKTGVVPMQQLRWAWERTSGSQLPPVKWYMISGLGAALGDTFGYICTPYVAGPIQQLLVQSTLAFSSLISFCTLGTRYSAYQCLGLLALEIAVVVGVVCDQSNATHPYFALLLGVTCSFNALAFVAREFSLGIYKATQGKRKTLSGFVVNCHESLFQLPFTLLLVTLAQVTWQTEGEDVLTYLRHGLWCLDGYGHVMDLDHLNCTTVKRWLGPYVIVQIMWNLLYLLNVKVNGALPTFVGVKMICPISSFLFAYVDWPVLHFTPIPAVTWFALVLVLPCTGFFMWESMKQSERAMAVPSQATCCWPFGDSRYLGIENEGNVEDMSTLEPE